MTRNAWQGERVRLRAVEPEDWEQFHRWESDSGAQQSAWQTSPPRSREASRQWAREQAQPLGAEHELTLAVETKDGKLVGSIATRDCDWRNGTFHVGMTLGRDHWGKGYASEAFLLLLRYYFDELRYRKANGRVYDFGRRAIALYERLGFQEEGCIRSAFYGGGEYHDVRWFGMTDEEFRERHGDFRLAAGDE
jgi:RimJ/RimL family protein N-acetyltransferase